MREYRIVIGAGEDRNGVTIGHCQRVDAVTATRKLLADTFGGYTEYEHQGGWVSHGHLITERGITYSVLEEDHLTRPVTAATEIGRLFNQAAVIIIYPNGDAEIICPEYENQADEPLEDVLGAYADARDTFGGK